MQCSKVSQKRQPLANKSMERSNRSQMFFQQMKQMFFKLGVLKNFPNFTGKHLCWNLFLIKFLTNFIQDTPTQVFFYGIWKNIKNTFSAEHPSCCFCQKRLQHRCLPVKFMKFLRTPFLTDFLQLLLLNRRFSLVRLYNNKN